MKLIKDTTKKFFADTYALIEIISGNPNYKDFFDSVLVTSKFNLLELYFTILRYHGKEEAEKYLHTYKDLVIPISYNSISMGMQFKLKYLKENLSYVDCIGYALALELDLKFLTGDQKFKDKFNVEFMK